MLRSVRMMMALFGLLVANAVIAAEVAMPTEAEVKAAVQAQADRQLVCAYIGPAAGKDGVMTLYKRSGDEESWNKRVNALVAAGLAVRKDEAAGTPDKPLATAEYTKAGHEAFDSYQTKCLGIRKVTTIRSFTPPGQFKEYTVVHVGYWWVPSQVPAWADKLVKSGAFDELENLVTKQQWANDILIYTNHGWTAESDFGSPIKRDSTP